MGRNDALAQGTLMREEAAILLPVNRIEHD